MGLLNLFKKQKNIELIDKINKFSNDINSVFSIPNEIKDDDIQTIRSCYQEQFDSFSVMLKNNILKEFCKKNGLDYESVLSFITRFNNLDNEQTKHNNNIRLKKEQESKDIKIKENKYSVLNVCNTIYYTYQFFISQKFYCGPEKLVKYLRGSKLQQFIAVAEQDYKFYNIYYNVKHESLINIINWMINKQIFVLTESIYPTLRIKNDISIINEIDYKECNLSIELVKDPSSIKKDEMILTQKISGYDFIINEEGEILTDQTLFNLLRQKRRELADRDNVDLFVVAWNKMLINLATYKPTTKEEYTKIPYCGEKSFSIYGEDFVSVINEYLKNK